MQPVLVTARSGREGSRPRAVASLRPARPRVPAARLLVLLALLAGVGLMHGVATGHGPLTTPARAAAAHQPDGHDHAVPSSATATVLAVTLVRAPAGTAATVPADPGCEHPGGCAGHDGDGTGHSAAPCVPLLASSLVLLALLVLALTRRGGTGLLLAAVARGHLRPDLAVLGSSLRPSSYSLYVLRI